MSYVFVESAFMKARRLILGGPYIRRMNIAQTKIRAACQGFRVKKGTTVSPRASLWRMGGAIELGNYTEIHCGVLLWAYGGTIVIGDHCSVNPYTIIYGHGDTIIGNHVRIAAHVVIIPANHHIAADAIIAHQPLDMVGVRICDDVWIGAGAKILDGTKVETGCVIGAGSVVTKTTEQYGIYVGMPARKIGDRRSDDTTRLLTAAMS